MPDPALELPPLAPHEMLRERLRCAGAALSCWITAACFLVAWWWPRELDNGRWIKLGVGILVAEFIVIHATAMMTATAQKGGATRKHMFGLLAFYALFAFAITAVFKSWVIAGLFALLLGTRGVAIFHLPDARQITYSIRRSAVGGLLFVMLAFASIVVPFPRGGVTGTILSATWPDRGRGLWERQPERALAMGLIYFAVLGWVERKPPSARWLRRSWS